jgi:hypothetical protein
MEGRMRSAITSLPVLVSLVALGCSDDRGARLPASPDAADVAVVVADTAGPDQAAGSGADAPACKPLAAVQPTTCPATWEGASAAHAAFCAREWSSVGLFDATLTTTACRGFLRWTRHLFDGGPRYCLYDPTTRALVGYRAFDGKAHFEETTCGSSIGDYDGEGCTRTSCADLATTFPACTWPTTLEAADAVTDQCRVARVLLSCELAAGARRICLAKDLTSCSAATGAGDAGTDGSCTNLCATGEYAVACGKPGPGTGGGTGATPPAGCKTMFPTPGGVVFACCPCGS